MGTDIHGRLQVKSGDLYIDAGEIDRERNYRVFAMLAGVRNGCGFAGVKTHEPLVPIAEPRGLPEKIGARDTVWDPNSGKFVPVPYPDPDDSFMFGEHSQSWVYLSEIIAWDGWDKPLAMTGILDAEEFARVVREGDTPSGWCGGISGRDIVIVSSAQARAGAPHTHVQHEWQVPFRDYAKQFSAWIEYLRLKYDWELKHNPEAVRIVFGFDS